uniref:WD repeat-containing protein 44 n=1 Tax=Coccidioides posadasii RMSCC 3488 TaxID=454284 RepID=A0A0J6FR96_COCPO|nr:WD repeat-containing protein 44 [Coccidioides posadasii RMSCC 3488]
MAAETYTRPANGVVAPLHPGPNRAASQSIANETNTPVSEKRRVKGGDANGSLAHGNQQPPMRQGSSDWPSNEHSLPATPVLTRNSTTKSASKGAIGSTALLQQRHHYSSSSTSIPTHATFQHTPIDPLSQQILKRTNTEKSISSKLRTQAAIDVEPGPSDAARALTQEESPSANRADNNLIQKSSKEKNHSYHRRIKGVSFLSRIIGNKKRTDISESNDDVSELGENRAAGMDAEVFAQPIGYIPRFPPPPKYIKVRAQHKKTKDFNRLFVAQELSGNAAQANGSSTNKHATINVFESDAAAQEGRAIWTTEFSKDGKYFAAAGQDRKVRVWAVIGTPEDRQAHEIEEEARNDQPLMRLSAPVFKTQPVQEYEGHTASIVDLSWSKNNFLLSTSLDKTVRLWHVTRRECLCCFNHSDVVTSIEFHPRDDRFFLAGSLDSKLRLWSIPDKNVAFTAVAPDLITAVAFTPDGKHSIAGCLNGQCVIFETDGLKVVSQIHITGIDTILQPPGNDSGIVKILITSNDSRIRLYNFRDRTLEAKFRGNENSASQIRASFSSDGRYIICGSEDRRVYIWPVMCNERFPEKRPVESFEAHSSMATTAVMAPLQTKQTLGSTGDLLYDLCNPPPVTLVGQTASAASRSVTENGGNEFRPGTPRVPPSSNPQKPEEYPTHTTRSSHPGGNIIVAADYSGVIKVFRQDCGYHRRRHESWDSSSLFSKRLLGQQQLRVVGSADVSSRSTPPQIPTAHQKADTSPGRSRTSQKRGVISKPAGLTQNEPEPTLSPGLFRQK